MSNETVIKGASFVGIVIILIMLFHKYGAQILAALGGAALAKGLLSSGLLAAPPTGSNAEAEIDQMDQALSEGQTIPDGSTVEDATGETATVEDGTAIASDGTALVEGGEVAAEGLTLTEVGEALLPLAAL